MGGNGEKGCDFYRLLGLHEDCTEAELKNAYKKLALRWHPDRWSASGDSGHVEEAKRKFQAIQEAYSVLSDGNKRFLYDVGIHDSNDDENGMAEFLSEMAAMMSENNLNNRETSFDELKDLFEEMFASDIESLGLSSKTRSFTSSSSFSSCGKSATSINKRGSPEKKPNSIAEASPKFCLGADHMKDAKRGCFQERRGTKHGPRRKSCQNGVSSSFKGA